MSTDSWNFCSVKTCCHSPKPLSEQISTSYQPPETIQGRLVAAKHIRKQRKGARECNGKKQDHCEKQVTNGFQKDDDIHVVMIVVIERPL